MAQGANNYETAGLKRAGRIAARSPSWFAAIVLFILMAMTFVDVILRSAFNSPLAAGPELTKIFMALIVFSALPLVTWRGEGIVVDLLDPFFQPLVARIRDFIIDLVSGVLLFLPAIRIWEFVGRTRSYGDTTEFLEIPLFYVVAFVAVSTLATACVLILRAFAGLVRPDLLTTRN